MSPPLSGRMLKQCLAVYETDSLEELEKNGMDEASVGGGHK